MVISQQQFFTAHRAGKMRASAKYMAWLLFFRPNSRHKLISRTPEGAKAMADMIMSEYRALGQVW